VIDSTGPRNEALHDAVQLFVAAAWDLLGERGELESVLVGLREFKWVRGDTNFFQLVEDIRPLPRHKSSEEIRGLPENLAVVQLLEADPIVGPMQGKMIHLGSYAMRFGNLDEQAAIVLDSLLVHPDGWSQEDFDRAYLAWEGNIYAEWNEDTALYPLNAFSSTAGPIRLGPNTELRRMADDEIATCLRAGVLAPSIGMMGIAVVGDSNWCIAGSLRTRRAVVDPAEDRGWFDEANRMRAEQSSVSADFVCALRLHKPGAVHLTGQVSSVGNGGYTSQRGPLLALGRAPCTLDDADLAPVLSLLESIRDGRVRDNGRLQASLRRFGYSYDRLLAHDKIIDLMIAAEGWFVGSGRDELRYRLAANGANWMADSRPRRQTFEFLCRAYDVRSSIVHGATPAAKDMVSERGERLDESAFAPALESFMRDALRIAVERVALGKWEGDWLTLAFGDSTAEPQPSQPSDPDQSTMAWS
jgi:hypothetical protein